MCNTEKEFDKQSEIISNSFSLREYTQTWFQSAFNCEKIQEN